MILPISARIARSPAFLFTVSSIRDLLIAPATMCAIERIKMLALGEKLCRRVWLSGNDRRAGQAAVAAPETVAQHIHAHRIGLRESARRPECLLTGIKDAVPVEHNRAYIRELGSENVGTLQKQAAP